MKPFLLLLSIFILFASCGQQKANASNHAKENNEKAPYEIRVKGKNDSAMIVRLLKEGCQQKNDCCLPLFFAKKFIGYPYVAYQLDQELEEGLVINIGQLDCTTYVEYITAMVVCTKKKMTSFQDFCKVLTDVRYIGGKVAYTKRQHYFTIWLGDNLKDGLVENIALPASPLSAKRKPKVDYMTKHVESYKMLNAHRQWVPEISEMENKVNEMEFAYIPKEQLRDSNKYRKYVKDGDIIAIVTNRDGLDISHVGFAIWHKDGLHLLNASSKHKKVVDEPMTLYQYLQNQKSSVGIRVARIK